MKKFEVNHIYTMRSPCDHNCTWSYIVIARTAQTITISDGKEAKKCRINAKISGYIGAETIYPLGRYSMAPSLTAWEVAAP